MKPSEALALLHHVFTPSQLDELKSCRSHKARLMITTELLGQINEKTGQQNDPGYWAYLCEWVLTDKD